jgi:AbrB family looped-hinge helix DNA binding protein
MLPAGFYFKASPMRVNAKGEIVIPADIREKAGIRADDDLECAVEGDRILLFRKKDAPESRGAQIVAHLRGRGDVARTTDDILAETREG